MRAAHSARRRAPSGVDPGVEGGDRDDLLAEPLARAADDDHVVTPSLCLSVSSTSSTNTFSPPVLTTSES